MTVSLTLYDASAKYVHDGVTLVPETELMVLCDLHAWTEQAQSGKGGSHVGAD